MPPDWRDLALVMALAAWSAAAGLQLGGGAAPASSAAGTLRSYRVYFLGAGGLVPVQRTAPRPLTVEQAAAAAFQALCDGPPPGVTSAVRPHCRVQRAWRAGDTLHVQMQPPDWDFVPGVPAANAWDDQMEMTAAQFPGIRRLQFWTGGHRRPGGPMPVDGKPNYLRLAGPKP